TSDTTISPCVRAQILPLATWLRPRQMPSPKQYAMNRQKPAATQVQIMAVVSSIAASGGPARSVPGGDGHADGEDRVDRGGRGDDVHRPQHGGVAGLQHGKARPGRIVMHLHDAAGAVAVEQPPGAGVFAEACGGPLDAVALVALAVDL